MDGLVQKKMLSIVNALELRLSCTNPSILHKRFPLSEQSRIMLTAVNRYRNSDLLFPVKYQQGFMAIHLKNYPLGKNDRKPTYLYIYIYTYINNVISYRCLLFHS